MYNLHCHSVFISALNAGLSFRVFFAKLRISSLLDSTDMRASAFTPPLDMKSLALSSATTSKLCRVSGENQCKN